MQDEHPALPDNLSEDMQGFLLECFRKDPQRRPGARALLRHAWLRQQSATLRSAWSSTVKARGGRTDAHASVTDVVERILRVGRMHRLIHASALMPCHIITPGAQACVAHALWRFSWTADRCTLQQGEGCFASPAHSCRCTARRSRLLSWRLMTHHLHMTLKCREHNLPSAREAQIQQAHL